MTDDNPRRSDVFGVRVVPTAAECPLPLAAASRLDPDLFVVIPVRC